MTGSSQTGTPSSPSPTVHLTTTDDEIDLVDLMQTIWDLRMFILGGCLAGLISAVTVVPLLIPNRYVAKLHVSVDIASLPALSAPEEVTKKVNEQLGSERADRILTQSFLAEFPALKEHLDNDGFLFDGRDAQNSKDLPVFLSSKIGSNHFLVTANMPIPVDKKAGVYRAVTEGLNSIVALANQDEERIHRAQVSAALQNARTVNTSTAAILRDSQTGVSELINLATQIQTKAYRLDSRVQELSPQARVFLERGQHNNKNNEPTDPVTQSDRSADYLVYQQSNERLSRSFTILGLMDDEKRMDAAALATLKSELSGLQAKLDAAYAERATLQKLIDGSATNLSETLRLSSQPIDRAKTFLPQFKRPQVPAATDPVTDAQGTTEKDTDDAPQAPSLAENLLDAEQPIGTVTIKSKPGWPLTITLSLFVFGLLGLLAGFAIRILPKAFAARSRARGSA